MFLLLLASIGSTRHIFPPSLFGSIGTNVFSTLLLQQPLVPMLVVPVSLPSSVVIRPPVSPSELSPSIPNALHPF